MLFIEELIDSIVDNRNMPKVQVERELSPILDIFMPDILKNIIGNKGDIFKYILSEFPLQKVGENTNRSTNIDSLFLQNEDTLVFIELKTDNSSYHEKQKIIYKNLIEKIEVESSAFLFDFLDTLAQKSKKKKKYIAAKEVIEDNFNGIKYEKLKQINKAKLIYIVPVKTKEKLLKNDSGLQTVCFKEISEITVSKYEDEWAIISNKIVELDEA